MLNDIIKQNIQTTIGNIRRDVNNYAQSPGDSMSSFIFLKFPKNNYLNTFLNISQLDNKNVVDVLFKNVDNVILSKDVEPKSPKAFFTQVILEILENLDLEITDFSRAVITSFLKQSNNENFNSNFKYLIFKIAKKYALKGYNPIIEMCILEGSASQEKFNLLYNVRSLILKKETFTSTLQFLNKFFQSYSFEGKEKIMEHTLKIFRLFFKNCPKEHAELLNTGCQEAYELSKTLSNWRTSIFVFENMTLQVSLFPFTVKIGKYGSSKRESVMFNLFKIFLESKKKIKKAKLHLCLAYLEVHNLLLIGDDEIKNEVEKYSKTTQDKICNYIFVKEHKWN